MLTPSTRIGSSTYRNRTKQVMLSTTIRRAVRFGFRPMTTRCNQPGPEPVSRSFSTEIFSTFRDDDNLGRILPTGKQLLQIPGLFGIKPAVAFLSLLFRPL